MADIFLCEDLNRLMKDKHVVFMGDSTPIPITCFNDYIDVILDVRAIYKDFLCLSHSSALIYENTLRQKMESSVFNDRRIRHGERSATRGFKEERVYSSDNLKVSFFFITRVFEKYVLDILKEITCKNGKPDVIVINSCLWDITRWGPNGVEEYRKNLVKLMREFNRILSDNCLVIWLTTLPLSQEMKGGFLVQQLDFLKYSLRFHLIEANNYARKVVVSHGYDILDLHYHLRMQVLRRCKDGIHWKPQAVRYITNLLLTHISIAWNVPLPHRFKSTITSQILENINDENASDNQFPSEKTSSRETVPTEKFPTFALAYRESRNAPRYNRRPEESQVPIRNVSERLDLRKVIQLRNANLNGRCVRNALAKQCDGSNSEQVAIKKEVDSQLHEAPQVKYEFASAAISYVSELDSSVNEENESVNRIESQSNHLDEPSDSTAKRKDLVITNHSTSSAKVEGPQSYHSMSSVGAGVKWDFYESNHDSSVVRKFSKFSSPLKKRSKHRSKASSSKTSRSKTSSSKSSSSKRSSSNTSRSEFSRSKLSRSERNRIYSLRQAN